MLNNNPVYNFILSWSKVQKPMLTFIWMHDFELKSICLRTFDKQYIRLEKSSGILSDLYTLLMLKCVVNGNWEGRFKISSSIDNELLC